jgi:hypothetical protein
VTSTRLDATLLLNGASRRNVNLRLGGYGETAGVVRGAHLTPPRACGLKFAARPAWIQAELHAPQDAQMRDLPHGWEYVRPHDSLYAAPSREKQLWNCETRLTICEKLLRAQRSYATWPRKPTDRRPRSPRAQPVPKR